MAGWNNPVNLHDWYEHQMIYEMQMKSLNFRFVTDPYRTHVIESYNAFKNKVNLYDQKK